MGYDYNYFEEFVLPKLLEIKDKEKLFEYTIKTAPELIDGDGCTIFIFNPDTKKLEIAASNGIKEEDFEKTVYDEGEGFTGWVFKYGKSLYIPDENDNDYLNKIEPFPPEHAGQQKGKVCEIDAIGPFLAEPIQIGRYVVGVIRIPGAKGDKNFFTDAERALFHIFAEKLSNVIDISSFKNVINFAERKTFSSPIRKLITTYREIEKTNDKNELYQKIVENTPDIIDAAGCTIFLGEIEEGKKLFRVKATSSKRVEEIKDKYFYEEGEGFTGAVGKVGKTLILSDLNNPDEDVIKWKDQNNINFIAKPKGLIWEIDNIGSFIAVPIKVANNIIGVLRVVREKGKRKFDTFDLDILESISNQLGSTLTMGKFKKFEDFRKLIEMYREIEKTNDKQDLFNKIVLNTPIIIDADGCTIFLSEIKNGKKIFNIQSSSSDYINGFIGRFHFIEGEGFTGAVAKVGKSLILSDLTNPEDDLTVWKNENNIDFDPKHSGQMCEISQPGSFIAVPIKKGNEVIGVIRAVRKKGKDTFEKFYLELLESFSNQLALTIERVEKVEEFSQIKNNKFKKINYIFSEHLLNAFENCNNFTFSKEINDFIKNLKTKIDEDIECSIMDSLRKLWYGKNRKYNFTLFKDFKDYENYLYELPHYRDHFIHQYQVFLLGSYIICELSNLNGPNNESEDFASLYFKSLRMDDSTDKSLADTAWLITSTFHDIAYPIEKIDQLLEKFFIKFMAIKERLFDNFHFEPILYGKYHYLRYIDQFSDYYYYLKINKENRKWDFNKSDTFDIKINEDFRRLFLWNLMNKRDHGILSSLILLNQNKIENKDFSSIIFPSALAIALHNRFALDLDEDIIFEKNPLAFLLIYCDSVHEWGRDRNYLTFSNLKMPTLDYIKIYFDKKTSKTIIETKIILTESEQIEFKKEELRKIFSKLKSKQFKFIIIIENEPPPFFSGDI